MRFHVNIKDIVAKNQIAIILFILAIFFRLFRLGAFITFLGDQGRDAIIIKRIVTLEKFPAIGPATSVGHAFLGPFYYYLVAPFLLLFNFNPVGLAFAVSLIAIIGIIAAYFIIKKEVNPKTALIFTILTAFSYVQIQYSRFSWNPNPLMIFGFLTIYFFYSFFTTQSYISAILAGAFLGFSLQLHYLSILLLPSIILYGLYIFWKYKHKFIFIKGIILTIISFIFVSAPLIIFDLRHNFINSKSLLQLSDQQPVDRNATYLSNLIETVRAFFQNVFIVNPQKIGTFIIAVAIIGLYFYVVRKKKIASFIHFNLFTLITYILSFTLINSARYPHYYMAIYFSFFAILAYALYLLGKTKLLNVTLVPLLLMIYIIMNVHNYSFFYNSPNNQVQQAKEIADSIIARKPAIPYQVVALPYTETDGHIRYFLELDYQRPLAEDTLGNPKELYVMCYGPCEVFGNAQWQIAAFKDGITAEKWNIDGITIYKQIHASSK